MSTMAGTGEELDNWCESGTVCTRKLSNYISETKGSLAFGTLDGVHGSFDVVMRTNLNGRQPQYKATFYKDSGDTASFAGAHFACTQKWTVDKSCGNFNVNASGSFTLSKSFKGGVVYGNKLTESDEYFGETKATFVAGGTGYSMAPLRSATYNCPGKANCEF